MKQRLNWIDVSRGIAFLAVIYSHLNYTNAYLMHFFSPIFLTTFFFVSGYLFKSELGFGVVLEQRTRTLLLPMLSLGLVMIILNQIVTFNEPVPLPDRIKGLIFQNGENGLLWFVAALYVYSLFFYGIDRFCKSTVKLAVVALLLFLLNTIYSYWLKGETIPWHIHSMGYGCFYMALGKIYRKYELNLDQKMSKKKLWVCLGLYVGTLFLYNKYISFGGSKLVFDALFITLLGLLICIYLSKWYFNNNRFLLFIGANTLFYFAFHGKVYSLLQTLTEKFLMSENIAHSYSLDLVLGLAITLLDALLLIWPAMFVNKYMPQILGKGFKLW